PGTSFVAEVNPDTNEVTWEMTFEESADSMYPADMIGGYDLFHHKRYCDR
ncbi:MAG: hypothetical protein GWP91_08855, partial [Rhodobacterales bacterium]|nr:hypothetical protein [Rhodobacterales bacterium]